MNLKIEHQKSKTMQTVISKISLFLFLLIVADAQAQIRNVWVGGMPGRPIDWDVAANWSLQRVPNEFHDVVIPNTSTTTACYPVIDGEVEIHTLRIESGARLFILETGKLDLNATGSKLSDALANNGEIENRSHNLIGLHDSVFLGNQRVAAAQNFEAKK